MPHDSGSGAWTHGGTATCHRNGRVTRVRGQTRDHAPRMPWRQCARVGAALARVGAAHGGESNVSCLAMAWLCEVGRRRLAAGYDEGSCPINTQFNHPFVLCARPNPRQRAVRSGAASLGWLGYPTRGQRQRTDCSPVCRRIRVRFKVLTALGLWTGLGARVRV